MLSTLDRRGVFGETERAVERIAPGFFRRDFEAEHIARYRWAARYVPGAKVLDIACGTGYGAQILLAVGAGRVTSVDLSFSAVQFGVQSYDIVGVVSDAHRLPFKDGAFDRVVSLETLEHLATPEIFIGEVARVLRPFGVLALSTPNGDLSHGSNPYHLREFSLGELVELLTKRSLRPLGVWGQGWRLRASLFHRVRGLRRLAFSISKSPGIKRSFVGAAPRYWCMIARYEPDALQCGD